MLPAQSTMQGLRYANGGLSGHVQSLARMGGSVTGIDAARESTGVAAAHASRDPRVAARTAFRAATAEQLASEGNESKPNPKHKHNAGDAAALNLHSLCLWVANVKHRSEPESRLEAHGHGHSGHASPVPVFHSAASEAHTPCLMEVGVLCRTIKLVSACQGYRIADFVVTKLYDGWVIDVCARAQV